MHSSESNGTLKEASIDFQERLPKKSKVAYSAADAANGILNAVFSGSVTFFYNTKLGLSTEWIALAWGIFAVWNAINDPLFGILEDRSRWSKHGRHLPYVRFFAPIYFITFMIYWYPFITDPANQVGLFLNLLLVMFAFDTMFTIIGLVMAVLPAEMTLTQKSRSNLLMWRTVLGSIGLIVSQVVPVVLLTKDETTALKPAVLPTMWIIGAISCAILVWSTYHVKELSWVIQEKPLGFRESFKMSLKNKQFLIYTICAFSFEVSRSLLAAGIYYLVDYVAVFQSFGGSSLIPLIIVFGCSILFSVPSSKAVAKYGLKKTYRFGLMFLSIALIVTLLCWQNFVTMLIALGLIGIGLSPTMLCTGAIMADIMDFDELQTGKRRETSYAGVGALFTKPAVSVANIVLVGFISLFGFKQPDPITGIKFLQDGFAQFGIIVAMTVIPAVLLLFSSLIMRKYSLDGPNWLAQKVKLKQIHDEKEKNYIAQLQRDGHLG